ncbi:MAG: hypothetical protein V1859_08280 [archaeon]
MKERKNITYTLLFLALVAAFNYLYFFVYLNIPVFYSKLNIYYLLIEFALVLIAVIVYFNILFETPENKLHLNIFLTGACIIFLEAVFIISQIYLIRT